MSIRLYVKLPKIEIEKESLEKMFTDFEPSFTSKIIKERKNGKCRGFGFITVTDDEAADVFISKYNEQILIYEDQPIKDEDGSDFKLFVEKALPRTKPENSENSEVKDKPEIKNKSENKGKPQLGDKKSEGSNSRRQNVKKDKNRNNNSKKSTPFSESIQPDPRWAAELMKLKDMYEKQTT